MESTLDKNLLKEFYLDYEFATRALHAGEHLLQPGKSVSHTNAIYPSSTFIFEDAEHGRDMFQSKKEGYIYTRMGNPTAVVLEAKLNALEGKEVKMKDPENTRISSIIFSSGMSAISSVILGLMDQGDLLIRGEELYGCTDDLFQQVLPRFGISQVEADTTDLQVFEKVMCRYPRAKILYFETPTNPTLKVTDMESVVKIARRVNPEIVVVVDNTFATPYLQRPLMWGADVVVHSTTKYIGGHGTTIGGAFITRHDWIKDRVYHAMKDLGGCPSPFDAWLINMGLKTLPIRMERICANAMTMANYLRSHSCINQVYYPGFEDFPGHQIAKKQMNNLFGGIISFDVKGGYEAAKIIMDNTHLFALAVSLGGVDSLIQHPATMTHASVPEEQRLATGITDGLIRISVGLENVNDLQHDLDKALSLVCH